MDFSECRRILDIGCGTGTCSAAIAASYPEIQCDLIDLPAVAAIAKDHVRMRGVEDRVHVSPGNYLADALPLGYDAALLLAVIHQEEPATIEALLRKTARSLNPGGRLISVHSWKQDGSDVQCIVLSRNAGGFRYRACIDGDIRIELSKKYEPSKSSVRMD